MACPEQSFGARSRLSSGGLPMMIRGGGAPRRSLAFKPWCRMDPPLRTFAADAHGCIMVRTHMGLPNTSLWCDDRHPVASSPRILAHQTAARLPWARLRDRTGCAIDVQGLTPR